MWARVALWKECVSDTKLQSLKNQRRIHIDENFKPCRHYQHNRRFSLSIKYSSS